MLIPFVDVVLFGEWLMGRMCGVVFGGDVAVLHLIAPAATAAMTPEAGGGRSRRRASDIHMFTITCRKNK